MTPVPAAKPSATGASHLHTHTCSTRVFFQTRLLNSSRISPPNIFSTFAKPFDHFKPRGGGASEDIFRRFKIHKSEEEQFIVHWVRQPLSPGFLTRDEHGVLVFRISSSDISYLCALGIGNVDVESEDGADVEWTHVYDEQGISWLSRCKEIDSTYNSLDVYDLSDEEWEQMIHTNNGVIGRYGPSGLTTAEFPALRVPRDGRDGSTKGSGMGASPMRM